MQTSSLKKYQWPLATFQLCGLQLTKAINQAIFGYVSLVKGCQVIVDLLTQVSVSKQTHFWMNALFKFASSIFSQCWIKWENYQASFVPNYLFRKWKESKLVKDKTTSGFNLMRTWHNFIEAQKNTPKTLIFKQNRRQNAKLQLSAVVMGHKSQNSPTSLQRCVVVSLPECKDSTLKFTTQGLQRLSCCLKVYHSNPKSK